MVWFYRFTPKFGVKDYVNEGTVYEIKRKQIGSSNVFTGSSVCEWSHRKDPRDLNYVLVTSVLYI